MAEISEKIELLGKNIYKDIPGTITLKSIPTSSELDYVGAEDFDTTMVDKILPQAIEEDIDCRKLLYMDYQWICRGLRFLNYGPYHTVTLMYCPDCGIIREEYQIDMRIVDAVPLPADMKSPQIRIKKSEFIDFDQDITISIPTVQQVLDSRNDAMFTRPDGSHDNKLARLCYMITKIGDTTVTAIEARGTILNKLSPADFKLLSGLASELTNYGLRNGATCNCPKCGNPDASFLTPSDDLFFRPTLGNLRKWKSDKDRERNENSAGTKTPVV